MPKNKKSLPKIFLIPPEELRKNRQDFKWTCSNGRVIPLEKMNDVHLCNVFRLLSKSKPKAASIGLDSAEFMIAMILEIVTRDLQVCEYCKQRLKCLTGDQQCNTELLDIVNSLRKFYARKTKKENEDNVSRSEDGSDD